MLLAFPPSKVINIAVDWIEISAGKTHSLEALPNSILVNSEAATLRFKLRSDPHTADEMEFEMVLTSDDEDVYLKSDCWPEAEEEYLMQLVQREDGLLLVWVDEGDRIFQ